MVDSYRTTRHLEEGVRDNPIRSDFRGINVCSKQDQKQKQNNRHEKLAGHLKLEQVNPKTQY